MSAAPPLLLLWDIDGTLLLRAADVHRDAIHHALREVHGIEPEGVPVDPAGRTDQEIARQILMQTGVDERRIGACARDVQVAACTYYGHHGRQDLSALVAPGVVEVLEGLKERENVILALLTGNYEPIARMKLKQARIGRFFASHQGAFGSDAEDRAALPGIARRRAGGQSGPHPRERTVVIGDTPRDVACARADEVRCIGVATGPHPLEDLAGADAVAEDARGVGRVLDDWLGAASV